MLERSLDHRLVRFLIGLLIGLPITVLTVVGFVYGLVVSIAALFSEGANLFAWAGVLLTTLGTAAGVAGAWRRILKPYAAMSMRELRAARALLSAGVLSALALAAGAAALFPSPVLALGLVMLAAGGVVLTLATPVHRAQQQAAGSEAQPKQLQ